MNDIGGMLEEQTIDACAEELINDFDLLGDWEERYSYIIDLGKKLPTGSDSLRHEANKVQGCVSQVWLESRVVKSHPQDGLRLRFEGDSDASIVRGLIAIILRLYSDRTVGEILSFDASDLFMRLGLEQHLIPQRSNGLHSMLRRIRADAAATSDKQRIDPSE